MIYTRTRPGVPIVLTGWEDEDYGWLDARYENEEDGRTLTVHINALEADGGMPEVLSAITRFEVLSLTPHEALDTMLELAIAEVTDDVACDMGTLLDRTRRLQALRERLGKEVTESAFTLALDFAPLLGYASGAPWES